jgi:hypothetical protein
MDATTFQSFDKGRALDPADPSVAARYKLNDIFCTAWLSHAITALAQHGIPDIINDEALHVNEIAQKANLHAPSLYRVLRAVARNGIFCETDEGVFVHNDVSQLLRSNHPFSWKGMACMWNHPSCLAGWRVFSETITDGRSGIEHAFGKRLYEHLAEVPGGMIAFSDAMISNSAHTSLSIARAFPFERYASVTDLGGGVGTLLAAILDEHSHLVGINLEIGDLQQESEKYFKQRGLASRSEVVAGNFLDEVPAGSDIYIVKNSLWNWSDEGCMTIITNVRKAIGEARNKRFIVIEYIIDDENSQWTTLYDLQILNMPGGRTRTTAEYTRMLAKCGFVLERAQYVEDQTMMIARPF